MNLNIFCFIIFLNIISSQRQRNILVLFFPNGNNENLDIKNLYDNSNYTYHLIIHQSEVNKWKNPNKKYILYPYGNSDNLKPMKEEISKKISFYKDIFNSRLKLLTESFIKEKILDKLIKAKINFSMIQTNIPNYISIYLKEYFKIPLFIYLCNIPVPQFLFEGFDINFWTIPYIGRNNFQNKFHLKILNYIYNIIDIYYFHYAQKQSLSILKDIHIFKYMRIKSYFNLNSLYIIQFPNGIFTPINHPSNMLFFNSFILKNETLNNTKTNNYLFINSEIDLTNIKINVKYTRDENEFINQNIKYCLIKSDINQISKCLYFGIPIIVYGKGTIQQNLNEYLKETGAAIILNDNFGNINELIKEIDLNSDYKKNAERISKILKSNKNAKDEYNYWIEYGFNYTYKKMITPFKRKNILFLDGLDFKVGFIIFILTLIFLIIYITKLFLKCGRKKRKLKKD